MTIQDLGNKIIPTLKREGVVKAAIFGSYARGEANKGSDIDILVEYRGRKDLLEFVGLKQNLEDLLDRKVDLLTYDSIHPLLKDGILKEQKIIYEKRA